MASEAQGGKMGFNATWSMAVGGMVGCGIFSVLGVVIAVAGKWAWASFLLSGLIALATAHSYSFLARRYGEAGGAFTFLREMRREGFAGSLSWVLIGGYVLTLSVYAYEAVDELLDGPAQGACDPQTRNEEEAMPQCIVDDE